ncbi:MAG: hypothetical protein H6Q17_2087 [Bacteroidetes bacterium]|nr:hypothetical protein [Bacteroidota bacterium]
MLKRKDVPSMIIFGAVFPLLIALTAVVIWYYFDRSEDRTGPYLDLVGGLLVGLLIDLRYLKKWVTNRCRLSMTFIGFVFIVYNVMVYGFFMGFPVFNVFLSIIAGWYMGNRLSANATNLQDQKRIINRTTLFVGATMIVICSFSAYLALREESIGRQIEGMLGLHFEVTLPMVIGIIVVGGLALITAQICCIRVTIHRRLKINACK